MARQTPPAAAQTTIAYRQHLIIACPVYQTATPPYRIERDGFHLGYALSIASARATIDALTR